MIWTGAECVEKRNSNDGRYLSLQLTGSILFQHE